jgi:hypothetical protein
MVSMKKFWEEVLTLPYKSNSQGKPLHELQIKALLDKFGYLYEYQPNGPQASPDFRVTLSNGNTVDIECKSSAQTFPTFNSGLPKKKVVYILCSKKTNETTIFFAEDVVSESKRELYAQLNEDLNAVLKTYRSREEWQNDDRGFDYYIRPMYTQSGGKEKTNYFTHADRKLCESKVLNHSW